MPAVVLSAFLSPLFGNLILLVLKEAISTLFDFEYYKHLKESEVTLKKDLHTLKETLTNICEMNPVQSRIEFPPEWLEEIEDFFYTMNDLRDKPQHPVRDIMKFLEKVTAKVAAMQADLECKQKDMKSRWAQTQGETSSGQSGNQQDFWTRQNLWVKDKDTIVKELTEWRSGLLGVKIVGISGSGKTELAKAVIEDEDIMKSFPYTCSPPPFPYFDSITLETVKKEIEIVKKDIDPKKSERVLIFLDGLQKVNPDSWSKFRIFCGLELHPESKVLVTTQDPQIAKATGSFKHCLPKLCDDECFTMIQYFARSNGGLSDEDERVIEMFKNVLVQKCMGLPLLAKHIGLLLSAEGRGERENTVKKKLCSDLWMLEDFASVLGNLKLVLLLQEKPLLKWCLNYCSLFPPNNDFNKGLLVQLWMAEGLNRFQNEEEDFNDLLSHSIFQSSDNKETYEMHQLAYDFAQNVSSRTFYRKDIGESTSIDIRDITRHFSLSCKNIIEEDQKTAIMKSLDDIGKKCKHLRTFLLVQKAGNIFLNNPTFFRKLKRLRVLDLSYTNLTSLSEKAISALGYLRYLDLSSTRITEVPSLSKNPALQVLKLNNCSELLKLPKDLASLTNLTSLQVNTVEKLLSMPPRMGQLRKLRELEIFLVGNREKGLGIEELKEMNALRKSLQIARLENVNSESEARDAELINKGSLETLELRWTADSPNTEAKNVLKGLVPPLSLTELRITNYSGSEFPHWLSNPEVCGGLNTIVLDNCKGSSNLPSLDELGLLQHVHLKRMTELKELPALPSSVKSLIIEKSDALKQHCLDREAGWRKIRGIRVTIDSQQVDTGEAAVDQVVPQQSSSIQIGDSPAVNDSDSRGLHEDCGTPSRMDASRIVGQLDSSNDVHDSNGQNIDSGRQQPCEEIDESRKKGKQKVDEIASSSPVTHRDNQHRDENYSQKQTKNDTLDEGAHQSLNDEIQHVQLKVHQNEVTIDKNSPFTPPRVDGEGSTVLGGTNEDQVNLDQLQSTPSDNTTASNGDDRQVHQNEVPTDENSPSTTSTVDGEGSTALVGKNEYQANSDQLQSTTANNTTLSNCDDRQLKVHQNEVPTYENSPSATSRVDGEGSTTLGGKNEDQVTPDQLQSTTANNTTSSNGDDRQVHQNEVPTDENSPSTPLRVDGEGSTPMGGTNEDQVNSDQLKSTAIDNTSASNGDDRQGGENEDHVHSDQLQYTTTTTNYTTANNDDDRQERKMKSKRRSFLGLLSNLCGCVPKEHEKEAKHT